MMTTAHPQSGTAAPLQPPGPTDDRMNRNATALVVSSVLTSAVGFAFWVVAARTMSQTDVGVGGAAVAALVLLGNVSTLGLRNALPRFLPVAGIRTRQLILRSYAAAGGAAVLISYVFIAGAQIWAPELVALHEGVLGRVLFIGAVATWAVFILQDSVLIGLRHATWVPIENLAYAVGKLGLLAVLASTGSWALLVAWVIPALLVIGPLNRGIFTRLVPVASSESASLPTSSDDLAWRSIARFASGDHLADMIRFLGAEGVVLVVVAQLGAELSAPLFFAITIAATLGLVSSNIVSSFVAEASTRPHEMDVLLRRSARRAAALVVPGALIAAALAPLALAIFGSEYAAEGTTVLRLLLLAAIPQIVANLAIGVARHRRRVADVVKIALASSIFPLVGAIFLVPRFGIVAVGWTFLVGQIVLAAELLRRWFSGRRTPSAAAVQLLIGVRRHLRQHRRRRAAAMLFDELDANRHGPDALHPRRLVPTETDAVIAIVERELDPVVVKVALSDAGARGLAAHYTAVAALRWATRGLECASLLPVRVEHGVIQGESYAIETACPGVSAIDAHSAALPVITDAILSIHRSTARQVRIGDDLVSGLISAPIRVLSEDRRLAARLGSLERLETMLASALSQHEVTVARTHGDFWLGNVLVDPATSTPRVSGIIDWENSAEVGLPEVDLAHLWLSLQPSGMAAGVLIATAQNRFGDVIHPLRGCQDLPNPDLPARLVVGLAWLAHVSDGLRRSSRFALGRIWIRQNVLDVLDVFDALAVDCDR
jgi:O-antigen/teichoic acid export membrane protein/aminoglycoside phosphotransferase